jgi:hypothetical protein
MQQKIKLQTKFGRAKKRTYFIFFCALHFAIINSYGQHYQNEPQPELALGLKIVTRQIQYGKSNLYRTDPTSISIQPVLLNDSPLKISSNRYIDVVGQAGFLFCKAKVFDTAFTDPNTGTFIRQHSRNPTYMPLYFGVYNMSAFSIGAELFFWKGLGTRDIWGLKFISLGYSGKQFRFNAAGEWYAQVRNSKNGGFLFSFDLFVKLINDRN